MRTFWEITLIGLFVCFLMMTGWSLGYFMGAELCEPETAESPIQVPERDLSMPLLPEVPDRGPPPRTRF